MVKKKGKENKMEDLKELNKEESERKKLAKEDALRIQLNFAEMDKAKKDVRINHLEEQNADLIKRYHIMMKSNYENKVKQIQMEHDEYLADLEKRTGINIKGKPINFETLEVIDVI